METSDRPRSEAAHLETPVIAPVLRTSRLVLRPHRVSDADAWLRIEQDASIRDSLHWPVRDERRMLAHLRDRTRRTRLWQADDFLALAVELDGRVIGDVSMHLRDVTPDSRAAEVGWLQLSQHRGHGYATEAAHALLGFAFRTLEARWVSAVIDADNERSIALATRLGFSRVAQTGRKVTFLTASAPLGTLGTLDTLGTLGTLDAPLADLADECISCELGLCPSC